MISKGYFDYNATTPVAEPVLAEMLPYFRERFHNPSSFYREAGEVQNALGQARQRVASLLGSAVEEIYFTSGGTESDNLAIRGVLRSQPKAKHVVTSAIEHPAVLNTAKQLQREGIEVSFLPVSGQGIVMPDDLRRAIRPDTGLVTIMHANNEIGTIQPISDLAAIAHEHDVLFHCDAVQSAGKMALAVAKLGVDLLSISGHKIYGPKGVGVLFIKKGIRIGALVQGGGQERGVRPGTENVPAIVGIGKAAELALLDMEVENRRLARLRDFLEEEILRRIPQVLVNGRTPLRLANTLNISVKAVEGEAMLAYLDQHGLALSSGSACSAKSLEPSHVLLALGLSHQDAHGSLRISLGKYNSEEDVQRLLDVLPEVVAKLRRMSPFWADKRG